MQHGIIILILIFKLYSYRIDNNRALGVLNNYYTYLPHEESLNMYVIRIINNKL